MVAGRRPMPAPTSPIWGACSYTVTSAPSRLRALAAAAPPYPAPTMAILRFLISEAFIFSFSFLTQTVPGKTWMCAGSSGQSVADRQEVGSVVDEDLVDRVLVDAVVAQVRDEHFEDVVHRVALHSRPAQRAAVRIGRGEHLVGMAALDEAEEVVHAVLPRAGPE